MKEFKERTAVVTGAASGIGRAMVASFLEAGMKVVLADIDEERLETTVKSFKAAGGNVLGVPVDVSDATQVQDLAQTILDSLGAVHVLCNNAGVGYAVRSSWETPIEGWKWVLNVNLMGVLYGIQTFVPIMLEQDNEAHIVNTASVAGLISNVFNVPYGVSKHAVVALSESLHLELQMQDAKVKVSVLCPGMVNTDIIKSSERLRPDNVPAPPELTPEEEMFFRVYETWLERGMDPAEVARQVLEAIREERFYINTHDDFKVYIERRLKNILGSENPVLSEPPKEFTDIYMELMEQGDQK
jgi:NAD(P)-dependent dehydrogenase (short-subunit alcohol dehydrogenase family)